MLIKLRLSAEEPLFLLIALDSETFLLTGWISNQLVVKLILWWRKHDRIVCLGKINFFINM